MCVMLLYIILADLRRTKVFLKAVIPMVNALWRNFITKGPLTGLIIEDSRDSCVGLPVWCVNHATNFLFDQMLLLCNMPDSPKASKNSFKLLTSLVKNFSVDFKWNANSLAFFFSKHASQPWLCTHFKSVCFVGGGAVCFEQLSDVLFWEKILNSIWKIIKGCSSFFQN